MKITEIRTTPLLVPYEKPYHWAQGTTAGAPIILVEVSTDEDITGYGECIATPTAAGLQAFIAEAAQSLVGHSPFQNARLMADAYHSGAGDLQRAALRRPGVGRAGDGALGRRGQGDGPAGL
jgi:L-alanine-DL-glutamate epimerase-like enolase superfamily enzyme